MIFSGTKNPEGEAAGSSSDDEEDNIPLSQLSLHWNGLQ